MSNSASKLGKHQTMDPETRRAVTWIDQRAETHKILLSRHMPVKHGRPAGHVEVRRVEKNGLHCRVYSGIGLRDIHVVTGSKQTLRLLIEGRWDPAYNNGGHKKPPQHDSMAEQLAPLALGKLSKVVETDVDPAVELGELPPVPATIAAKEFVKAVTAAPKPVALPVPKPVAPAPPTSIVDLAPEVSSPIRVSVRRISPEVAEKWIEKNTRNRKLSQAVVDRYAKDMTEGKWGVGESVIGFDTNDDGLNGQHRLWAIFQSGVTVDQLVATGFPPDAIAYFDDNFPRDMATVYNLLHAEAGVEASNTMMSLARRLTGDTWRGPRRKRSRQDQFAVLDKHRDAIMWAASLMHGARRGISTSSVVVVLARAYYTADRSRVAEFARVVKTGIPADPTADSAAVLLRNWLLEHNVNNQSRQVEAYQKTERALKAFLNRENIQRNLLASKKELFPLPE